MTKRDCLEQMERESNKMFDSNCDKERYEELIGWDSEAEYWARMDNYFDNNFFR